MRLTYLIGISCYLLLITTAFAQTQLDCPIVETYTQLDDHKIYYEQSTGSSSQELILLIHGLFSSKNQWDQIFCQLANDGYTVIAPDLPGYGKSQGFPLKDYRLENQVTLLHQFLTQLDIKVPIHIAGSSMGGAIAALYADQYTDQVDTLAFLGAPLGIISYGQALKDEIYLGINPLIPINYNQFNLEMNLLFANPPVISRQTIGRKVLDYRKHNRNYVQIWNIINLDYGVLAHRDVNFNKPVFIAWGKEDKIFDVHGAAILSDQYTNGNSVMTIKFENAGHLLDSDVPHKLATEYINFLAQQSE